MTESKKNRMIAIFLAVTVTLVLGYFGYIMWRSSIQNEGSSLQIDILALQKAASEPVSKCLDTGRTAAGVSDQAFAPVKQTLLNVAVARYADGVVEGDGLVASASQDGSGIVNPVTWKTLLGAAVVCRQNVDDQLRQLKWAVDTFDAWRQSGNFFEKMVRNNFPTNALEAIDPRSGERVRGVKALEVLTHDISSSEVVKTSVTPK